MPEFVDADSIPTGVRASAHRILERIANPADPLTIDKIPAEIVEGWDFLLPGDTVAQVVSTTAQQYAALVPDPDPTTIYVLRDVSVQFLGRREITTPDALILVHDTAATGATTTVTVPLFGAVDAVVEWGDGSSERVSTAGEVTHTYSAPGWYAVKVRGRAEGFGGAYDAFPSTSLVACLTFGDLGLTSFAAFMQASSLTVAPATLPGTVTNLRQTFQSCAKFNQSLPWDVSRVTSLRATFSDCSAFNQALPWDVSRVTSLQATFFGCTTFNQPLDWDTSNVTTLASMFNGCTTFNQPLAWDTSSVTSFNRMFYNCKALDQRFGGWDIGALTDADAMLYGCTLSVDNYDATLNGWAAQSHQPNVKFHGGNSKYSAAGADARDALIADGWTITDGGRVGLRHHLELDEHGNIPEEA